MKTIRKIWVVALLAVTIFLLFHTISLASSVYEHKDATILSSTGSLSFGTMLGAEGKYRSKNPVHISILASQKISVTFSAEPLAYDVFELSGKGPALDVTYWVDFEGGSGSFAPRGNDLTIEREYQSTAHKFTLYGEVEIHDIQDQPAGRYVGTIWVTVIAGKL